MDQAEHIQPFLTVDKVSYFENPFNHEIYTMQSDLNTSYDLITGMPLSARWLCSKDQFERFKSLFVK